MANILGIANQQQTQIIDEEKLKIFCSQKNVWDHFGLDRDVFSMLLQDKQMQLVRKFYLDHLPRSDAFSVDSSIENAIRNSAGLSKKKIIENGSERTKLAVSTVNNSEEKKSVFMWKNSGYFGSESCSFSIEKANLPENTIFYVNQGYQSFKDNKKVYYQDVFIVVQIMPLAHQPKDIESYELKQDEVKFYGLDMILLAVNFLELNTALP